MKTIVTTATAIGHQPFAPAAYMFDLRQVSSSRLSAGASSILRPCVPRAFAPTRAQRDPLPGMEKRSFVTSADEHHERALARSEPLPN